MKIAIFGGSFNPVHNGHLQVAEVILKKNIVDEVWFIPCGNHAFDKNLIEGQKRWEMLNLATNGNPRMKVLDLEIKSKEKSYSAKTIRVLKEEFPFDFFFIIGSDNLKDLEKWNNFEYLRDNVEFIVVHRQGYEISNSWGIKMKLVELISNLSSTQVRDNLKNKKSISGLVPKEVGEYIVKGGLYK
jgi:nicotinate-nucleotide adenylyltransferase